MSVVIETTIGVITVDLFLEQRPRACLNFLKLCKLKYYNFNLFHSIQHDFIAQTGDPSGSGNSGSSVWGILEGVHKRFFEAEASPKIKHSGVGLISMVSSGEGMIGSQFFFTLAADLLSLDGKHCVFGEVVEGLDVLRQLNETICDEKFRPYKDVRITHTVILDDPFENPRGFREPSRSPSPSAERLKNGRIAADEDINETEGKTEAELDEMLREQEAKAQATILEIVGDLPDADMAPPENVLFVCKLNPVTNDDDLEIIFSRFGKIKGCEVIRDKQSGDSLQYAFVEFEEQKSCEDAYLKMDNVLIDDRRIHVDFSQSVAKLKWRGKGRGVIDMDEEGGRNGGRGGGGAKGNPRINFGDKNWKKGRWNNFQGRSNNRERSPVNNRREERERGRRSPERRRRDSPPKAQQRRENNVSSNRRSRSRSPRQLNRERDQRERRRDDGRREDIGDRRRDDRGRRFDEQSNRHQQDNRSRSRSPRRKSSPVGVASRGNGAGRYSERQTVTSTSSWSRQQRDKNSDRRSQSRELQQSRHNRDNDRESRDDRQRRQSVERQQFTAAGSGSRKKEASSSSGESSESDSSSGKRRKKEKKSKQKRNKTKKSKASRTSSDDSSSSEDSDDARRHRKKSKKNKKKHKKAK